MSGAHGTNTAPTAASEGPTQAHPAKKPALRGDIEGLRAIAVGTVLLFHMGVPWVDGGFAGVDVFFVISGFLITSLLLREASKTGTVSIADFYARRARRLLPAASVVLVFTAVVGFLVMPPASRGDLSTDVIAATLYVINWALALRSVDYLNEGAEVSPLQHYWSLSVEEQYYVFWPLIILVGLILARRLHVRAMRMLFGTLAVIAAVSLVYSVLHTRSDPATAYFYTTTRVWELAIGALTAFAVDRLRRTLPRVAAEVMAAAGLLMIGFASLVFTTGTPWPGSAALVPTVGTALVIAAGCAHQDTVAARLLSIRPMTWLGGISYSVYLWHWPLIILGGIQWPGLRIRHKIALGLLSVLFAWLTKRIIEDPIRFNRTIAARPSKALLMGAGLMALSVVSGLLLRTAVPSLGTDRQVAGATALVADQQAEPWTVRTDPQSVYTTSGELSPNPAVATKDVPSYYDDDCQVLDGDTQVATRCSYGAKDGDKVMALVGDSKMGQWFPAFEEIATREGYRLDLYLKSACAFGEGGSIKDECAEFTKNAVETMSSGDRKPDIVVSSAGSDSVRAEDLAAPLQTLKDGGAKIVVLSDNIHPGSEVYNCVADTTDYSTCAFPREDTDASLEQTADKVGATFVPVDLWVCPKGATECPPAIGETLVYRQGSHVTATYARTMTPVIWRELSAAKVTSTPVADIHVDDVPAATGSAKG